MKLHSVRALLGLLLVAQWPGSAELQNVEVGRSSNGPVPRSLEQYAQPRGATDLQFLERFALAEDRAEVLKELVPGTVDYYYFTCLYLQEKGQFDEVEKLLKAWRGRHGHSAQAQEIRNRQALLRYPSAPEETLAYLKSYFGLTFSHQRQLPGVAPNLPTDLDQALISRKALLKRALEDPKHRNTIDGFQARAYTWLLSEDLSPVRLRSLLGKLETPDYPHLPELIAKDLEAARSQGFGAMKVHNLVVREQLHKVHRLKPELLANDAFIAVYMRRLLPGNDDADWRRDPASMKAYLDRLWSFVEQLAPGQISLKAHVLYHRLAFDRTQGTYNKEQFLQYVKIPRPSNYVNPDYLKKPSNVRFAADLAQDFDGATTLQPIHSDELLVGQYLRHFFLTEESFRPYQPFIRESYLRRVFAETKLLLGEGDMEQWYAWLDPAAVDALKNRVDVEFVAENKERFGRDEEVSLDVWVKNVDRLLVKVFEIDTKNYYQQSKGEITTAIELDGLVANDEQVYTYDEAPLRRVRRHFTLPALKGQGVWVVELVGNGTSSRAVVAKGGLQYLSRSGTAGQVFTVFDETGAKVPDATIWHSERTYEADENGEIVLPFSTNASIQPFLLCRGDYASLSTFQHVGEDYRLATGFHVDGESLRAGRNAEIAIRPLLYLNGVPVPLNLLKNPVLDIRSRTHDGIESRQQITDIALQNNELTIQTFRVPENLAELTFGLRGTVEKLTGGDPVPLYANQQIQVNGIHALPQTAALFLTRGDSGYALEIRDKTGLGIADRVVNVTMHHRDFTDAFHRGFKTDEQGHIDLGLLKDIKSINAGSAGVPSRTWPLIRPSFTFPNTLQGGTGEALRLPWVAAIPDRVAEVATLLEQGPRAFLSNRTEALTIENGYLTLSGLSAGDYMLHLKDTGRRITVRLTDGVQNAGHIASEGRVLATRAPTTLQIQSVAADGDGVKIHVGGANSFTRLHVVATRFLPDRPLYSRLNVTGLPSTPSQTMNQGYALYTSGRQIGDEYRYILERRFAEKFPGNMLERPSLLLNPWAMKETVASQEGAARGEAPDSIAPPPPASSPAPMRTKEMKEEKTVVNASPNFDFLDGDSAALYNLKPDDNGVVTIAAAALQGRSYLQIVATDPFATVSRYEALNEQSWTPRDLRLAEALTPDAHLVEKKRVRVLETDSTLKVSLTGDADVQVYDSVPSVLSLLMTLNNDPKWRKFRFVGRWPLLSAEEKLEKFSSYESHELNFFLYHKDRAFFDSNVRPFLANKYQKTFMDRWLLEDDLGDYLEPWRLGQLNLVEKILLVKRNGDPDETIPRKVRDALEMIPPNPERFNRLFMAALHGGALGGGAGKNIEVDGSIRIRGNFFDFDDKLNAGEDLAHVAQRTRGGGGGFGGGGLAVGVSSQGDNDGDGLVDRSVQLGQNVMFDTTPVEIAAEAVGRMKLRAESEKAIERRDYAYPAPAKNSQLESLGYLGDEVRDRYRALYRAPEKTQALVENDYYELPIEAAHPGLVPVNPFWLDYAEADPGKPFLSPHVAEAASGFTEAMLALAVLDLPFASPVHTSSSGQGEFTLEAGGGGIAFYKDIEAAEAVDGETPVLVSQNYFRQDDRFRHEGNQRFDKFVTDEFLTGVVYGCQVTVTNPTSMPRQIEVLRQVPAGTMPVNSGRYAKSERLVLDAYSTNRLEYFFYFPMVGDFVHYPVHVSQNGALLAFAAPRTLSAVAVPSHVDTTSWAYVSQQASTEEVIDYLKKTNLNRINLDQILWRMADETFYHQVIDLLNTRTTYAPNLWAYAIRHNDAEAIETYLRHRPDFVLQTGPYVESDLLTIDPVERKTYQHIEYAPLINPRAHHPGGKWAITNAQFLKQYRALMNVLAHRPSPRQEDVLALSYYLLLQDRVGAALRQFERVVPGELPTRVQYDYLDAYFAFYQENPARAELVAAQYEDYPVERWRKRFADVAVQAAEITGASSAAPTSDAQPSQDTLAATEPQLDLEVKEDTLALHYRNLEACKLSFYPIDLEMLFTRSPFALAGSDVFAGVKPLATQTISFDPTKTKIDVSVPNEFIQRHVVIKVEAAGIRRTDIRYASSLVAQLVERYGQIQVIDKADNKPLTKVYVKVFAELQNGQRLFYRDGYTDLRGRFDYASSSTMDIGNVREFSILVISEAYGAKVLRAAPPAR